MMGRNGIRSIHSSLSKRLLVLMLEKVVGV
jgi:hypothetical protein